MNKKVVVVGGGASGLAAAIAAAMEGASVTILEHTGRVGKKLLSTGNGKCNLTNLSMPEGAYRGRHPEVAAQVIEQVTVADTIKFFEELGILTMDKNGYIYPNSGQASSVLDVLRSETERLGVKVICDCKVTGIAGDKSKKNLRISAGKEIYQADAVILAAGSKAFPSSGSDGSGYVLAEKLGHHVIKPLPALVQLRCRETYYKQLAGVRTDVKVGLISEGKVIAEDQGELQLTDYGISGIPVFQVSRFASEALDRGKGVAARIDFLPAVSEPDLERMMEARLKRLGYKEAGEFLTGVLNHKLSQVLLKLAGISLHQKAEQLDKKQVKRLIKQIKFYETEITGTNPFANAQVCCGGVDTSEIDPQTMQSRLVAGLYLAGEILDIDGICGGYNLQWAWSSGILAGKSAGKKQK